MARKTRRAPRKSGGGFFDFLFGSSNAKNEKTTAEMIDMVETVPEVSVAAPMSEEVAATNMGPAAIVGGRRKAAKKSRKAAKKSRKAAKKSRKAAKKSRKAAKKSRK